MTGTVDPARLVEQLAHVRQEREHIDRVIAWLEEGLTLFVEPPEPELVEPPEPELVEPPEPELVEPPEPELVEPPEPPPADPPPLEEEVAQLPAPREAVEAAPLLRSQAGARDLDRQVLGVIRESKRPLAFADIRTAVDASHGRIRSALQRLAATGQIHAEGATTGRRYSRLVSESAAKRAAGAANAAAKVQDGVARVVFRDHVAKAIAADSGCLNEDRLAAVLNADRGDVAEACSWLLEHHQINRADDGTYTRRVGGRARLRAAA